MRCVTEGAGVVIVYTAIGGMWAVAMTDFSTLTKSEGLSAESDQDSRGKQQLPPRRA